MSELRSVIEALRTESLAELPDARIEEDFEDLHLAAEQLEAERLRRLAEIDRRGLFERDGHLFYQYPAISSTSTLADPNPVVGRPRLGGADLGATVAGWVICRTYSDR